MKTTKVRNIITNITTRVIILTICVSLLTLNSFAQKRSILGDPYLKGGLENQAAVNYYTIYNNQEISCADLNASSDSRVAHITTNYELKLNFAPPFGPSGPYHFTGSDLLGPAFPDKSVSTTGTMTNGDGELTGFNWTSTLGISAVIVKTGGFSNVYPYPQGSFGDTGLTTTPDNPNQPRNRGISHITFCYYIPAKVTIIKEVDTFDENDASTQSFPFSAVNFTPANFSLVDNNSQPADRITAEVYSFGSTINVTEALVQNWTLTGIACVETAGGGGVGHNNVVYPNLPNLQNSQTHNFIGRTANINVEQGENVVCKFTNGQVAPSAASAFISGRVLTSTGLPLRRAAVTVFNANTLETQTVYTNQLGYYRVDNLPVNNFYIVTVGHGKRTFANNSQSFTLSDNLTDVNFFMLY
jgi:hypothetical protein